jgi:hypothetical protein
MLFDIYEYRVIMEAALRHGWRITGLKDFLACGRPEAKVLILRHDVDRRPGKALKLAEFEFKLNIRGTYYFRYSKKINPLKYMADIFALGHEVGYHYEVLSKAKGDINLAKAMAEKELADFRRVAPCLTACAHGAPFSRHSNNDLWPSGEWRGFGLLGDATHSMAGQGLAYLTDTGRQWNSGSTRANLRDSLPGGEKITLPKQLTDFDDLFRTRLNGIYLTIHPERWGFNQSDALFCRFFDSGVNFVKKMIR